LLEVCAADTLFLVSSTSTGRFSQGVCADFSLDQASDAACWLGLLHDAVNWRRRDKSMTKTAKGHAARTPLVCPPLGSHGAQSTPAARVWAAETAPPRLQRRRMPWACVASLAKPSCDPAQALQHASARRAAAPQRRAWPGALRPYPCRGPTPAPPRIPSRAAGGSRSRGRAVAPCRLGGTLRVRAQRARVIDWAVPRRAGPATLRGRGPGWQGPRGPRRTSAARRAARCGARQAQRAGRLWTGMRQRIRDLAGARR